MEKSTPQKNPVYLGTFESQLHSRSCADDPDIAFYTIDRRGNMEPVLSKVSSPPDLYVPRFDNVLVSVCGVCVSTDGFKTVIHNYEYDLEFELDFGCTTCHVYMSGFYIKLVTTANDIEFYYDYNGDAIEGACEGFKTRIAKDQMVLYYLEDELRYVRHPGNYLFESPIHTIYEGYVLCEDGTIWIRRDDDLVDEQEPYQYVKTVEPPPIARARKGVVHGL
jgi:hypothetical protein